MIIGNTYTDGSVKWKVVNNTTSIVGGGGALPIGSIIPYLNNSDLPEGYLFCNGAEILKSEYEDLYNVIGDGYGTPSDNDHFVLPDLRNKFIEGSTSAGTSIEAGLPNITGEMQSVHKGLNANNSWIYNYGVNGVFDQTYIDNVKTSNSDGFLINLCDVDFDASRSNSIYGKSTTVQPPALTAKYIIKALKIENEGINIVTPYNTIEKILTSGTWTAPIDGWYKFTLKGGGGGGGSSLKLSGSTSTELIGGGGGGEGGTSLSYEYILKGDTVSITIGSGGNGAEISKTAAATGTNGGTTSVIINGNIYSAYGGTGGSGGLSNPHAGVGGLGNLHVGAAGGYGTRISSSISGYAHAGHGGGEGGGYGTVSLDKMHGIANSGGGGSGAGIYSNYSSDGYIGANGGSGYVYIEYYDPNK